MLRLINLSVLKSIAPGFILCAVAALIAQNLSIYSGVPVMLCALGLGIVLHVFSKMALTTSGVQFTSRSILRAGVVLIGGRIVFDDLASLGAQTIILVVCVTLGVILFSICMARILKLDHNLGLLLGGATAICGASAALALSAVLPQSKNLEKNTLMAVVGVTCVGTILMLVYPFALGWIGLNHHDAGILIGGTIHDVSQVVGAGYSISQESGDTAILIKLIRVFMLLPVIFIFAFFYGGKRQKGGARWPAFPLFIAGFLALVVLNSMHVLPPLVTDFMDKTSKAFLVMSIVAVGIKTSLRELFSLGVRPLVLIGADTAFIIVIYAAVLAF